MSKNTNQQTLGVGADKLLTDLSRMPKSRYKWAQKQAPAFNKNKKVGRNDPCPCGRVKVVDGQRIPVKAKNCHFLNA